MFVKFTTPDDKAFYVNRNLVNAVVLDEDYHNYNNPDDFDNDPVLRTYISVGDDGFYVKETIEEAVVMLNTPN